MSKNTTSTANTIRQLIKDGYTNKAIFAHLQAAGTLSDKQKHYPAWYRSELRRAGSFTGGNTRDLIVVGVMTATDAAAERRARKNAAERARRAAKKLAA